MTMNVYRIYLDLDKFHFLGSDNQKEWERMRFQPQGQPFHESWIPARYSYCSPGDEDYNPNAIYGDFIGVGHEVGLTAAILQKVGSLFAPYGELLPLNINGDLNKVFWFHCINVLDALDESKSRLQRFPNGRIAMVDEYAFFAERIGDNEIFYAQGTRQGPFFTEPFKQKIEAQKLTGLEFILLWSDEPAGIAYLNERRLRNMSGPSAAVN
jgi:hypothetical protein